VVKNFITLLLIHTVGVIPRANYLADELTTHINTMHSGQSESLRDWYLYNVWIKQLWRFNGTHAHYQMYQMGGHGIYMIYGTW